MEVPAHDMENLDPAALLHFQKFYARGQEGGAASGVIIVATVDGMLAGLSRADGHVLWSHHAPHQPPNSHRRMHHTPSLLDPWVSTTTSSSSSSSNTFAIPSIHDGKVYITMTSNNQHVEEIIVDIPSLVARAPVADRGTIFTGYKSSSVTALDVATGEWITPESATSTSSSIVWLGRADYHVTLQGPGSASSSFSYASLQSVSDMVLPGDISSTTTQRHLPPAPTGEIWSTPGGALAWVPHGDDRPAWVTQLSAPIAVALDADDGSGGQRLAITMVPDPPVPSMDPFASSMPNDDGTEQSTTTTTVLMGSSTRTGPFAMPLRVPIAPHRTSAAAAVAQYSATSTVATSTNGNVCAGGGGPGITLAPRCLSSSATLRSKEPPSTNQHAVVVPFFRDFNAYDVYHRRSSTTTVPTPARRKPRRKVNVSYLFPTLLALLVGFFEVGRRIRDRASTPTATGTGTSTSSRTSTLIQVCEDQVLGHGGGGTVVLAGTLEGRPVAVKRLLTTFHASAEREISLLMESDGHPNVVRYFLKEVCGDFVYLALELCDVSLQELIGQLLRRQTAAEDEATTASATREILRQIVHGVTHLHGLRIVHRDLKPANILLAVKGKKRNAESTYDVFARGGYVAKVCNSFVIACAVDSHPPCCGADI